MPGDPFLPRKRDRAVVDFGHGIPQYASPGFGRWRLIVAAAPDSYCVTWLWTDAPVIHEMVTTRAYPGLI